MNHNIRSLRVRIVSHEFTGKVVSPTIIAGKASSRTNEYSGVVERTFSVKTQQWQEFDNATSLLTVVNFKPTEYTFHPRSFMLSWDENTYKQAYLGDPRGLSTDVIYNFNLTLVEDAIKQKDRIFFGNSEFGLFGPHNNGNAAIKAAIEIKSSSVAMEAIRALIDEVSCVDDVKIVVQLGANIWRLLTEASGNVMFIDRIEKEYPEVKFMKTKAALVMKDGTLDSITQLSSNTVLVAATDQISRHTWKNGLPRIVINPFNMQGRVDLYAHIITVSWYADGAQVLKAGAVIKQELNRVAAASPL